MPSSPYLVYSVPICRKNYPNDALPRCNADAATRRRGDVAFGIFTFPVGQPRSVAQHIIIYNNIYIIINIMINII